MALNKKVILNPNREIILEMAFKDCLDLSQALIIPYKVKIIENFAFDGCKKPKRVDFE
jgi:hypothetical protein